LRAVSEEPSARQRNLELVLDGWVEAIRRRDLDAVAQRLAPDVVWQGVEPHLRCPDRDAVLGNLREAFGDLPDVEAIELAATSERVMFGVRSPDLTDVAGVALDGQVYDVFTIADGLVVRIDEFKTRDEALAALAGGDDGGTPP
jgi:ketosteroid isomerase-like protein